MSQVEILYKVGDSNPGKHSPMENWRDGQPINLRAPGMLITPEAYRAWVEKDALPPGLVETLKDCCRAPFVRLVGKVRYALSAPDIRQAVVLSGRMTREQIAEAERLCEKHPKLAEMPIGDLQGLIAEIKEEANRKARASVDAEIRSRQAKAPTSLAQLEVLMKEINARHQAAYRSAAPSRKEEQILAWRETKETGEGLLQGYIDTHKRACVEGLDTNWGFDDLRIHSVLIADLDPRDAAELFTEPTDLERHAWAPRGRLGRRAYRVPYEELLTETRIAKVRDKTLRVDPPRKSEKLTLFTAKDIMRALE